MERFIYTGNRAYVLKKMLDMGLRVVHVLAMKGSYLEKEVQGLGVKYTVLDSKKHMLSILQDEDYDILISNGCGYIIPVSLFPGKRFINIHPSFLPDLRGKDPIIAAILFERPTGATCHVMDDNIDNGDIITQVEIPCTNDLDSPLLYQLSFAAEVEAFETAYRSGFQPQKKQDFLPDMIYYSYQPEDRILDFAKDPDFLLRKIRAFSNRSKGCFFKCADEIYKVFKADIVYNDFLKKYADKFADLKIIFVYEDNIILKINGTLLRFSNLRGPLNKLNSGDSITAAEVNEIINQ